MDCNYVFLRKRTVIGVAKKEKDIPRPAVSQMHPLRSRLSRSSSSFAKFVFQSLKLDACCVRTLSRVYGVYGVYDLKDFGFLWYKTSP